MFISLEGPELNYSITGKRSIKHILGSEEVADDLTGVVECD